MFAFVGVVSRFVLFCVVCAGGVLWLYCVVCGRCVGVCCCLCVILKRVVFWGSVLLCVNFFWLVLCLAGFVLLCLV